MKKKKQILENAIEELKALAEKCGKSLNAKTLKNLFLRKRAYQKDWPQEILRRKATMIAGSTLLALEEVPTETELVHLL